MKKLRTKKIDAKAYIVKGTSISEWDFKEFEKTQIHIAISEDDMFKNIERWDDELYVDSHDETEVYFSDKVLSKIRDNYENQIDISKFIKKEFIEDCQFLRYFRSLFSNIYEEMKGIEITIPDSENLNNGKDILYEKVPESRLEFLMYLKSTIDFMIQEEKNEAAENNISIN